MGFERIGTPQEIKPVKVEEIVQEVICTKCGKAIEAIKRKDNVTTISGQYIVLGKIKMTCPSCKVEIEI